MKPYSQRRIFTTLMTILSTLFGTAYGVYELRGQPDFFADIVKVSGLLAMASICASYVFWTVTHFRKDSVLRSGLAGLLTGLAIVPVPYFTSSLTKEISRIHKLEDKNVLMSIIEAIPFSLRSGLETFQIISKVSLIAVLSSVILGVIVAKSVPPRVVDPPLLPK